MVALEKFSKQNPILAYILLCFGITWAVWFSAPSVAGTGWAVGKIVTGIGFGPALAAIILNRLRGDTALSCLQISGINLNCEYPRIKEKGDTDAKYTFS